MRESPARELFSRVGLGIESRTVASLSVQQKWFLGREGWEGIYKGFLVGDRHPVGTTKYLQAHWGLPSRGSFSGSFNQVY